MLRRTVRCYVGLLKMLRGTVICYVGLLKMLRSTVKMLRRTDYEKKFRGDGESVVYNGILQGSLPHPSYFVREITH